MRCPSCGAEQVDGSGAFCSKCGRPLGSPEAEATQRLSLEQPSTASDTTELAPKREPGTPPRARSPFGPRRALYDFAYVVRNSLVAGGWFEAASAAFVGLLALLCVGAVFVAAAKLQFPDLGSSSSPLSVFTSIVVLALGSLRVPVHLGDLTVTALPLGALMVSAGAVSWAVEPAIRRRHVEGMRARVAAGAKIAVPFALFCWIAALVFRFRGGDSPTHAGATGALLLGGAWGALFGVLGGLRSTGSLRAHLRAAGRVLETRRRLLYEGARTGMTMFGLAAAAAAAGGLIWVIVALARGAPVKGFGQGDALAAVLYILAFLPNILVAIVAIAIGAPLDVGAQITIGGRQIGPLETFSLWRWGEGAAPWFAYALLLVPLLATVGAGYLLHERRERKGHESVIGIAAIVFALALAIAAWLGQARLGAGLVRAHGFGQISPNALIVLALGFAWAALGGFAGWTLAERRGAAHARPPDRTDGTEEAIE
jgi:hypothetical protein